MHDAHDGPARRSNNRTFNGVASSALQMVKLPLSRIQGYHRRSGHDMLRTTRLKSESVPDGGRLRQASDVLGQEYPRSTAELECGKRVKLMRPG